MNAYISFSSLAWLVINNICVSVCAKTLKDALNFSSYNSISPDFPIYSVTDYRRKSIIGLLRFKKKTFSCHFLSCFHVSGNEKKKRYGPPFITKILAEKNNCFEALKTTSCQILSWFKTLDETKWHEQCDPIEVTNDTL